MPKKKEGYLYFIRFPQHNRCYKIGVTSNLESRLSTFYSIHGPIEVIAYGFSKTVYDVESIILNRFYEYCNNKRVCATYPYGFNHDFVGQPNSLEYFVFGATQCCDVISAIGYKEEALNFFDAGNNRYVPYPTKFTDSGFPLYDPVEEWIDAPQVIESVT